jgi:hypothetical protein
LAFFFSVVGIEFRTTHLLGRHSTTLAAPPAPFLAFWYNLVGCVCVCWAGDGTQGLYHWTTPQPPALWFKFLHLLAGCQYSI